MTIGSADATRAEAANRSIPAARNAPCSCGSGRRFKNCCGALEVRVSLPVDADSTSGAAMQRALDLQRSHRLDEARALYQQVLGAAPDLPDAVHMLGVIHLQTGDYRQALPLLRRAAEAFDWNVAAARHNLGLAIMAAFVDAAGAKPSALWSDYDRYRDHRRASRQAFRGRVSIVVPSFNHARYVEAALDSLCRQTRPPDEIIVIDDGSTDSSVERIRAVLPRCPGIVTFRARGNRGAAATINEAVASSSGDYVNVLNSDDRFAATRLAVMVDAVAERGAEWGFSRVACIDAHGAPIAPETSAWAANLHYMADDVAACDTVGLAFIAGSSIAMRSRRGHRAIVSLRCRAYGVRDSSNARWRPATRRCCRRKSCATTPIAPLRHWPTCRSRERRRAAPRRELLPLGGQRRGFSRKRGGPCPRRRAAPRRSPPPSRRGCATSRSD